MNIELSGIKKYIGSCCGNSFIILDCRNNNLSRKQRVEFSIKNITKYAVDSALFIDNAKGFNISMAIFEKDGSESEACGNGIILIANFLGLNKGIVKMKNSVVGLEGSEKKQATFMNMKFSRTEEIGKKNALFVKMGEPHIIYLVDDVNEFKLVENGKKLQKNYLSGINVDAIQKIDKSTYLIRTYERGVLAETKSCGTGSMASYVAIPHFYDKLYEGPIEFKSVGGSHWVSRNGEVVKLETLKKFCKIKSLDELN